MKGGRGRHPAHPLPQTERQRGDQDGAFVAAVSAAARRGSPLPARVAGGPGRGRMRRLRRRPAGRWLPPREDAASITAAAAVAAAVSETAGGPPRRVDGRRGGAGSRVTRSPALRRPAGRHSGAPWRRHGRPASARRDTCVGGLTPCGAAPVERAAAAIPQQHQVWTPYRHPQRASMTPRSTTGGKRGCIGGSLRRHPPAARPASRPPSRWTAPPSNGTSSHWKHQGLVASQECEGGAAPYSRHGAHPLVPLHRSGGGEGCRAGRTSTRRCRPPTSTRRHPQAEGGVGGGSRRPYPISASLRRPDPSHSQRHHRHAIAPRPAPPSFSCCSQALRNGKICKSVTARAAPTGRVSPHIINPTGPSPALRAVSLV